MPTKKFLAGVAIVASVAGGGVAGALIGGPGLSGAQEGAEPTTTAPTTAPTTDEGTTSTPDATTRDADADDDGPGCVGGRGFGFRLADLAVAVETLGMTEDELRNALDADTSIADVAADQNVDVQTVIDALVADATADIDAKVTAGDLDTDMAAKLKADLVDHITELVNADGGHGPRFIEHGPFADLAAAADVLGMTEDELRDALGAGTSIADVAIDQKVDLQTVIDALVADATATIDAEVAAGDLDADMATKLKADLADRITEMVNADGVPGRHGPGGFDPDDFGPDGPGRGGPGF